MPALALTLVLLLSMCKWVPAWVWLLLLLLLLLLVGGRAHRCLWVKPSSTASAVSTLGGPGPHDVGISSIFVFAQFSIRNFHNFHCCGWQKYCFFSSSTSLHFFCSFRFSLQSLWQIVFIPFVSYFSQCIAIKSIRFWLLHRAIFPSLSPSLPLWIVGFVPDFVLIASGCCVCHRACKKEDREKERERKRVQQLEIEKLHKQNIARTKFILAVQTIRRTSLAILPTIVRYP